jgi:hypothetical protein
MWGGQQGGEHMSYQYVDERGDLMSSLLTNQKHTPQICQSVCGGQQGGEHTSYQYVDERGDLMSSLLTNQKHTPQIG